MSVTNFWNTILHFPKELDFERGIWSAALDGELARVTKLLASGTDPSSTDSSGYTALVRGNPIQPRPPLLEVGGAGSRH